MKVSIQLKNWEIKEVQKERKITGNFVVRTGSVDIATQQFNGEYGDVKIPFSPQLQVEAEALTAKIAAEITKNFTGEES